MIQEIRVKNFLSFRDEVSLNFEATKDTAFEDYQVVSVTPKIRLLRFALIYGANASGKSNLLNAIEFLRDFWFDNKNTIDEKTGAIPFLLDTETPNEPSEFNIKFFVQDKRYWYSLKLNNKQVLKEDLFVYNSVQPSMVFSRSMDKGQSVVKLNSALVKASAAIVEQLNVRCLSNMSFFAARNQVNCSLTYVDDVREWMKSNLMPIIDPETQMFDYAGKRIEKDAQLKKYILDFLHKADYNITDVYTEKEQLPIPSFIKSSIAENNDIPQNVKEKMLAEDSIEHVKTDFQHTVSNKRGVETYRLPNNLQSAGTKRTLGIETAIYEAACSNGILPIDEIESSLHPKLLEFIIAKYLKEKNRSQLIITSHYDTLLNSVDTLFRKDSVWFTEKEDDGHTKLSSLSDFNGLSKVSSFQKSYRNGVFGALPKIQD